MRSGRGKVQHDAATEATTTTTTTTNAVSGRVVADAAADASALCFVVVPRGGSIESPGAISCFLAVE